MLAVACAPASAISPQDPISVRAHVRDVIEDHSWQALEQGEPVSVAVLTPALKPTGKRGPEWNELRALVLPPSTAVALDVRPEDGPVRLRAFAGVDRTLAAVKRLVTRVA